MIYLKGFLIGIAIAAIWFNFASFVGRFCKFNDTPPR